MSRMLIVVALLALAGCSRSGEADEKEQPPETPSPAASTEDGMVGITLDLPDEWKAYPEDGRTDFWTETGMHFSLFTCPAGTTETDAVAAVATTIAPVVKEFEVESTEDAKVAGAPARHLVGPGVETDDGDDSRAEVYVFTFGDRVRVVCVHGEGTAAERLGPTALGILETMKAK